MGGDYSPHFYYLAYNNKKWEYGNQLLIKRLHIPKGCDLMEYLIETLNSRNSKDIVKPDSVQVDLMASNGMFNLLLSFGLGMWWHR